MKPLITIFFLFAFHFICEAQTDSILSITDQKVNNKIQELKSTKADTIVCYYINCAGYVSFDKPDTCTAHETKYLFWASNGRHFIQRFDECSEHLATEVHSSFFTFLKNNFVKIENGEIKYPEYTFMVNGKKKSYLTLVDHSCHYIFEIHIGNKRLRKDIDDYALDTKYDEEKHLNKNYFSNKKSMLNKLKTIIEQDVNNYNK